MSGRRVVEWVGRHRALLSAGLLGAVFVSLAVLLVRKPEPPRVVVQAPATRPVASPPVPALLVVHLSGEVIMPGVYQLPVGARIDDALKAAGGPTESGDIQRLNLAARLADGQQIVVPRRVNPIMTTFANSFALDLSSLACNTGTNVTVLNNLYTQWDGNLTNPLLANEVAQEIWYILDNLIKIKYPAVENIVIVGGDNIIPFYRVPDQTVIANEADYAIARHAPELNEVPNKYFAFFRAVADRQASLVAGWQLVGSLEA